MKMYLNILYMHTMYTIISKYICMHINKCMYNNYTLLK